MSSLREFSGGLPVEVTAFAPPGEGPTIANKARKRLYEFYDLFRLNCEHLANEASQGNRESPQLQRTMYKFAGGMALLAFLRRK